MFYFTPGSRGGGTRVGVVEGVAKNRGRCVKTTNRLNRSYIYLAELRFGKLCGMDKFYAELVVSFRLAGGKSLGSVAKWVL